MNNPLTTTDPIASRLPSVAYAGVTPVLKDDPTPEVRVGAVVAAAFFVGFLGWATFAPMDSAAYAPGKIVVSGNRQTSTARAGWSAASTSRKASGSRRATC